MKKNKFATVIAFALNALGLKELPKDKNGQLALNEDQDKKLSAEFGNNYESFKKAANEVLAEERGDLEKHEDARKKANEALVSALNNKDDDVPDEGLEANASQAAKKIVSQQQQIDKMAEEPEVDESLNKITASLKKNVAAMALLAATSTTHLFGIEKPTFSRKSPWNNRAALELSGKTAAVTDFSDASVIADLNADLKNHYTKNPEVLRELKKDRFGLPAFWPKQFNVTNATYNVVIDVANVTQGRKPDWSPNPEFFVDAEKRKNYAVQIDVEFSGYELQQYETAWINTLFDMDGSSPYKFTFAAYLIDKIDKQARLEDRISSINGVYVFKPKGIKTKGYFLNRQNGLRAQLMRFRDFEKKIEPFKSKLGELTLANAYEYYNECAEWLPNPIRTKPGMCVYCSPQFKNAYQKGYKLANALHQDYTGNDLNYIEGYPNLRFVTLLDLEGSNVFFITDENNIEILENVPNEKSIYRFEYLKRNTYIHADYYQTAAFVFAGFKLPKDSPFLGQAQFIWMNDAPLFSENFQVPMYGNHMNAPVKVNFNRVKTDVNLLSDVITIESELPEGQFIKIEGNTGQLTNSKFKKKTATNGGNLDLTSDFNPKNGGTLLLLVTADGLKEISRTSAPATSSNEAKVFTDVAIDVNEGNEFIYKGASSIELAEILNGQEGAEIKIFGQATNTLTVKTIVDKLTLTGGDAVLDASAKYLTLKKFDGIWIEIARG